ncbi:MAG TPA: hypothetical protein VLF93_07060 [Candidatus Saccharimonadales bacterium]|nr:hypothetical protein [Candidatus Saccharimonadales bacterium]
MPQETGSFHEGDISPLPSTTQLLLDNPLSGAEDTFLETLESRFAGLRTTHPIRAELAIAGEFYSEVLNVFVYLSSLNIMDGFSRRVETDSLVADTSGAIPVYVRGDTPMEQTDQYQAPYHGALNAFSQHGLAITIPAVNALTEDVQYGSAQDYQHLWDINADAFLNKREVRKEFKSTDRTARMLLPFPLSTDDRDTAKLLQEAWFVNITDTALNLILTHAVSRTVVDGEIPGADELATSFQAMENNYVPLSSINRLLFSELQIGHDQQRELNQERMSSDEPVVPPKRLIQVLDDYIANPRNQHFLTGFSTEGSILQTAQGPLHQSLAQGPWNPPAECAARTPVLPRPQDRSHIERFEHAIGSPLPERFSAARVLLRVGNELARKTIYADPRAREGIGIVARHVRQTNRNGS